MKLFDIKVFTSDREFNITLRNLTIIRASQIIHRISIASTVLLRSIKRFLVPGKVVIQPLILIRSIKSLSQMLNISLDASMLFRSFKRVTMEDSTQIDVDVCVRSMKKIVDGSTWRVAAEALIGARKAIKGSDALALDADVNFQKVRKRKLGEVSLVRLADMEPMTLDELDYVVED